MRKQDDADLNLSSVISANIFDYVQNSQDTLWLAHPTSIPEAQTLYSASTSQQNLTHRKAYPASLIEQQPISLESSSSLNMQVDNSVGPETPSVWASSHSAVSINNPVNEGNAKTFSTQNQKEAAQTTIAENKSCHSTFSCPPLNATLEDAYKKGVLENRQKQFVRYMALELSSISPVPDDSEALCFAEAVGKKYPIFADPNCDPLKVTAIHLKRKIQKSIRNKRDNLKNAARRREEKKMEGKSSNLKNVTDSEITSTGGQEIADLKKRRCVVVTLKSANIEEIFDVVPAYEQFETIKEDFYLLDIMKGRSFEQLVESFNGLLSDFRSYLSTKEDDYWCTANEQDDLKKVNDLCSSYQGIGK